MNHNLPNLEVEDSQFTQLFETFLHHLNASSPGPNDPTVPLSIRPPPTPPPSEPDVSLMELVDFVDQDFYTALADSLDFPNLPMNWKRILYHAYTDVYSAVVSHVPRVHRFTLIAQSVALAKQRCEQANASWAAEENQSIKINGLDVPASLSRDQFRQKLYNAVGKAEWSFHDRALTCTIDLLVSKPGYPAMMPRLPGPAGTLFDGREKEISRSYFTWDETIGHSIWHSHDGEDFQWFQNFKLQDLLLRALKDESSIGYLGLQEACQDAETGIWTWRGLRARGTAAISIISYVLASASVSISSDFVLDTPWDQDEACPQRRAAIEEEQSKIYEFLNQVLRLTIPGLTGTAQCERARDGLMKLLDYLDFAL